MNKSQRLRASPAQDFSRLTASMPLIALCCGLIFGLASSAQTQLAISSSTDARAPLTIPAIV